MNRIVGIRRQFASLNNKHVRNLLLLIIIPVVFYLCYGLIEARAAKNAFNSASSAAVREAGQRVEANQELYDVLAGAEKVYHDGGTVETFDPGSLKRYFPDEKNR